MPIELPKPIAAYFAADRRKDSDVALHFTENAVVVDERRTHAGRDAIRAWKAEAAAKYDYASEPVSLEYRDGVALVTGVVTGNFPGSPADLHYAFTLEGDAIARLEITP